MPKVLRESENERATTTRLQRGDDSAPIRSSAAHRLLQFQHEIACRLVDVIKSARGSKLFLDLQPKNSNVFATTRRADRVELIPDTKRKLSRLNIYTGPRLLV
jgi:hypothetical protein